MKQIAALLLSTVALLTFTETQAAERWGWSALTEPQLMPAAKVASWVPIHALTATDRVANRVRVVPLTIPPTASGFPETLAAPSTQWGAAVEAVRTVVARDPDLVTTLRERGYQPDDVVGLSHAPSGSVTLFVGRQV
jgi:hypothetical protein